MKIDCISDLHGCFPELDGGDLLIIAGDCTSNDKTKAWQRFFDWLDKQQYRKKIIVAGNHDNFLKHEYQTMIDKPSGVDYLCDSGIEFEGYKIWGSPWSLWFPAINPDCAAFTDYENGLQKHFDRIPGDTDILITHTPPYLILDENDRGIRCGSVNLRSALDRVQPLLHVFGHIHEQGGKLLLYKHQLTNKDDTLCVNASIMDGDYEPTNKPTKIII